MIRRLLACGLAIAISGCQPPPPRGGITFLTMKPDQKDVWDEAFSRFRRAHPDIPLHVEISPRSSTQYHDLLSQRLKNALAPRYAWADALAVHFSHLYRNAYVLSYLLAAAAVLIAVAGAYVENPILKLVLVALELFVVVMIIQLVRYGSKNAWHERWIDYRLIAESLRYGRFLAPVLAVGRSHAYALE